MNQRSGQCFKMKKNKQDLRNVKIISGVIAALAVLIGLNMVFAQYDVGGGQFPSCPHNDPTIDFNECCTQNNNCAVGCPGYQDACGLRNGIDPTTCSNDNGYCLGSGDARIGSWIRSTDTSCEASKSCYCRWGIQSNGACNPYTYSSPSQTTGTLPVQTQNYVNNIIPLASRSARSIYVKMDENDGPELWRFHFISTYLGYGCGVRVTEEDGGFWGSGDDDQDFNAGIGEIIRSGGDGNLDSAIKSDCSSGNPCDVLKKQWQQGIKSKCGDCSLSVSNTNYRPKADILCGQDEYWYLCDAGNYGKVHTVGGLTYKCSNNGQYGEWLPVEICSDGVDNDGDSKVDCSDENCYGTDRNLIDVFGEETVGPHYLSAGSTAYYNPSCDPDTHEEICEGTYPTGFSFSREVYSYDNTVTQSKCCGDDTADCGYKYGQKVCVKKGDEWKWIAPDIFNNNNLENVVDLSCSDYSIISYNNNGNEEWLACKNPGRSEPFTVFDIDDSVTGTGSEKTNPFPMSGNGFACSISSNRYVITECCGDSISKCASNSGYIAVRQTTGRPITLPTGRTLYCSGDGAWVKEQDLDSIESLCDEPQGGEWTGTRCCHGDSTYPDTDQLCWEGSVIPDCIFLDGNNQQILFDSGSSNANKIKLCGIDVANVDPSLQGSSNVVNNQCSAAPSCNYHCSIEDGVTKWREDRTKSNYASFTADGQTTSACCQQNQCWDGETNQCVNEGASIADNFCQVGVDGHASWIGGQGKLSLKTNESGYCLQESECLVTHEENGVRAKINFGGESDGVRCIGSGNFIKIVNEPTFSGDDYCNNGNWETRTSYVANKLLREAAGSTSYMLFCDNPEIAFNSIDYYIPGSSSIENIQAGEDYLINNVCILAKGQDVFVGTSLNRQINAHRNILFAVKQDWNYCNNVGEASTGFNKCTQGSLGSNPPIAVAYNPEIKALYYANKDFTPSTSSEDLFSQYVINTVNELIPDVKREFSGSIANNFLDQITFQPKSVYYRKISDEKKVIGIFSGDPSSNSQFIIIYLFPTDSALTSKICPYVQSLGETIHCKTVNAKTVIVGQGSTTSFEEDPKIYWTDLTTKLKVS